MSASELLLLVCGLVALVQTALCLWLVRAFRCDTDPPLDDADCPPVLAVLCLRGTDPFLPRCLQRLFTQDYPDYHVRVVIDSPSDPACRIVEDVRREVGADHVEILTLESHDEFCSAKMSSLLLATADLPEATQVVATIDGDCVMHPSCLRELVSPLVRQDVAVSTGNRWFAPPQPSPGGIARMLWNLGCVPVMHAFGLPWGGCLAMQRGVIEDEQLRDRYRQAFGEDTLLGSYMRQNGRRVKFVSRATIVNREDISLSGLYNFLSRQVLTLRLHHHQWVPIVAWGCLITALPGVICPLGMLIPELRLAAGLGLILILLSSVVSMVLMGRSVRKLIAQRGERLVRFTPRFVLKLLPIVPLTQWLTLAANLRSVFARSITWRGLTYRLARQPRVRLIREVPVKGGDVDIAVAFAGQPALDLGGEEDSHRQHQAVT